MKSQERGIKWFIKLLASKETMITLLTALCVLLAVTTFSENAYIWNIIRILFGLTALNLVLCTWQRIKGLSMPVLFMHIGVIITLIGGAISIFGFVATVNIYEGSKTDMVYRWDIKKDASIGAGIMVKKLHEEYYPVAIKVGVLKNGQKYNLFILKTGEVFDLDNYRVHADSLDFQTETLRLSIYLNSEYLGSADTSGIVDVRAEFPYEFKLVAYKDPVIKKAWVDLRLIFVGLQITRDPGLPYVYIGFGITAFGGVFYILRRFRGIR
ncbi:MAG: ResB-like family cytochrome C biogenesis protein [Nitrospirae bacterium]|nr:ResB-like family cytochrome C biogenesis protein [Nitrospirota bacterium]